MPKSTSSAISPRPKLVSPDQLIGSPWTYLGLSRSAWHRVVSTGSGPRPVYLPGTTRPKYRKADLDAWLASL